jgi:hypothetical protein
MRHSTVGSVGLDSMRSEDISVQLWFMSDEVEKTLACGCRVKTSRDFLGRVVGTILTRGPDCPKPEHADGHTVVMPGRENARPE